MLRGVLIAAALAATAGAASAQNQAQIERGMKVYADQKCSVCHAIAGKGNPKGALDNVGISLKADENLSKEDLDALVTYMLSLKKK